MPKKVISYITININDFYATTFLYDKKIRACLFDMPF